MDWWSWAHLGAGAALGFLSFHWAWIVTVIVAFEGLEAALRRVGTKKGGLFEYESWSNIIADIVIGVGGYAAVAFFLPGGRSWP